MSPLKAVSADTLVAIAVPPTEDLILAAALNAPIPATTYGVFRM